MTSILDFIEAHPGLFAGFSAIVSGICAVGGMALQYYRNLKERDALLDQIELGHERDKVRVDLIATQKAQLAHRDVAIADLKSTIENVKSDLDLEQIQHEVDVTYVNDERVRRERWIRDEVEKRIAKIVADAVAREAELVAKIQGHASEIVKHEKMQKKLAGVLNSTMKLEGRLWTAKPLATTPRFRPASERGTAIVSVLNLKGGVGKTTVTANLAAAFANKGYRVLLVDLDLQGSLTSLFFTTDEMKKQIGERRLLQNFLNHAVMGRPTNLRK